jgi:hypothetical protein
MRLVGHKGKGRRAHGRSALGIAFTTPATSRQAKWLRDLLARTRELVRIDKLLHARPVKLLMIWPNSGRVKDQEAMKAMALVLLAAAVAKLPGTPTQKPNLLMLLQVVGRTGALVKYVKEAIQFLASQTAAGGGRGGVGRFFGPAGPRPFTRPGRTWCCLAGRGPVRSRRSGPAPAQGRPYFQVVERRADCHSGSPTQPSSAFTEEINEGRRAEKIALVRRIASKWPNMGLQRPPLLPGGWAGGRFLDMRNR